MPDVELPKIEEKPVQEDPLKDAKFPHLGDKTKIFYDDERHEAWVGIPLEKVVEPVVLMAAVDGCKMKLLEHLADTQRYMVRKAMLAAAPAGSPIKRAGQAVFQGLQKAKSLIS